MSIDIKSRLEEGNCLIVLDTNVLLNTYRYSPQFTEFAMECLKAIAGWVVLPATVRLEYEKHRRREFSGMERRIKNAASNTEEQITKMKDKVLASCNNFERLHFPDIAELKATLEHKLDELTGVLEAFFEERSTLQLISHSWNGNDLLMEIISGLDDRDQVMPSPSQEDIYKWCEEGEDRYKRKMPPGFEDAKNKDGVRKYSDSILWKEVLRCASANKKDIIFVTDDVKADWWETISGSRQFHPRLIEEFSKTGMQIFPFVSYDFYKEVSSAFAIAPSGGERVLFSAGECAGLTHNLTHIRKQAGGGNGTESTIAPDFLEQKRPQSAKWRRFEGGVSVGKDEVSSSNLDSSSKKLLKSLDFGSFCSALCENNVGQKVGQAG